jgi:uncharacterized protein YbjQ (UPF0145 family)
MPLGSQRELGAEYDRLARGELASTTEKRLKELLRWEGFSSFMTPAELAVAGDADIEAVGQVVGLCGGLVTRGILRTTRPGQGWARVGTPRWRERTGPVTAWAGMRLRALDRLAQQARMLGANAVVGIAGERWLDHEDEPEEGGVAAQVSFSGTAVRVRAFRTKEAPVLTLASAQELWAMLRAGVEPVGIAGGFASVETSPSAATVAASAGSGLGANVELDDLTASVYEVRRLAMERLVADARGLKPDGLLGVDLDLEGIEPRRSGLPKLRLTVHVLASAVRRRHASASSPSAVVGLAERAGG